jgi:hypothetical protein
MNAYRRSKQIEYTVGIQSISSGNLLEETEALVHMLHHSIIKNYLTIRIDMNQQPKSP